MNSQSVKEEVCKQLKDLTIKKIKLEKELIDLKREIQKLQSKLI